MENRIKLIRQLQNEEVEKEVKDIFTNVIPKFATMEYKCDFNNQGNGPVDYVGFLENTLELVKGLLGTSVTGPEPVDELAF